MKWKKFLISNVRLLWPYLVNFSYTVYSQLFIKSIVKYCLSNGFKIANSFHDEIVLLVYNILDRKGIVLFYIRNH